MRALTFRRYSRNASTVIAMTVIDTPLSADAQKVSDLVDELLEEHPPASTVAA